MSQKMKAGLQIRLAVTAVALFAAVAVGGGDIFGETPSYVEADSTAFASNLLDLSRSDWSAEADVRFLAEAPASIPVVPQQSQEIDDEPVELTKGGATICPRLYTVCPQAPTQCEYTKCPTIQTSCPVVVTKCPAVTTSCPTTPTKCEVTKCPASTTICPVVATKCEFTTCPAQTTLCPVVATKCQLTTCPKTTQCGDQSTICYGQGRICKIEVGDPKQLAALSPTFVPAQPTARGSGAAVPTTFMPKSL